MTADPGAYDVPGRSLEARHERILAEWEARGAAIVAAAGLSPADTAVLAAARHAMDATEAAARTPRAAGEFAVVGLGRWRPVLDALVVLDEACDHGLSRFDDEFGRLWGELMDRLHRARGTWPMGGAA